MTATDNPVQTPFAVRLQGSVNVESAHVIRHRGDVATLLIDTREKRVEHTFTGTSFDGEPIVGLSVGDEPSTIIFLPEFSGWWVWAVSSNRWDVMVCLVRRPRQARGGPMTLDIAALRQALSSLNYSQRCTVLDANAAELLDAADERDRLREKVSTQFTAAFAKLRETLGRDIGSGGGLVEILDGIDRLRSQRDALLAACLSLIDGASEYDLGGDGADDERVVEFGGQDFDTFENAVRRAAAKEAT